MRLNSLQIGKANLKQACGGVAEIDDHKKEGRERVDAEMRAQPPQLDRQDDGGPIMLTKAIAHSISVTARLPP